MRLNVNYFVLLRVSERERRDGEATEEWKKKKMLNKKKGDEALGGHRHNLNISLKLKQPSRQQSQYMHTKMCNNNKNIYKCLDH